MKHLAIFFILFVLARQVNAQSLSLQPDRYTMLTAGAGMLFPIKAGKQFSVSFNYTTTSRATGATTTHTFLQTGGPFQSRDFAGDLIRGTWVRKHNSFEVGAAYNQDVHDGILNGYFHAGYGYIFRFGRLQVQPTLDLYWALDEIAKLGTIDNSGVDVHLLGRTAPAQWTVDESDINYSPVTYTYKADKLRIDYNRSSLLAVPKLVAGVLLSRRFYAGIEAGWLLQLSSSAFFTLTQYAGHRSHDIGTVNTDPHGSLGGPEIAFNIGYCFGGDFHRKKK
ncbi:MAG TPA: hypothetical protein VGM41_11135 [Chitinophagaceae bacterium]